MAANNNFWIGSSGDVNTAGNWSDGVPDAGDFCIADYGTQSMTSNLTAHSAVAIAACRFIGTYSGSVGGTGASNASLTFGAMTATTGVLEVDCNGGDTQEIWFGCTSCPNTVVRRTSANPYGLYLTSGTYTDIYIRSGNVRIGGSCTVSGRITVEQEPGRPAPNVILEQGLTLSGSLDVLTGYVKSTAALAGTVTVSAGGTLEQAGTSTVNIGTLDMLPGAVVKLWTEVAGTVTAARIRGGTLDTTKSRKAWTFTTLKTSGNPDIRNRPAFDTAGTAISAGSVIPFSGASILTVGEG